MIENQIDRERTKEMRKTKVFLDRRSHITFAGHIYLRGDDRSNQREIVFALSRGRCELCGKALRPGEGDYEHIKGGRPKARCDCLLQVLEDGTIHTNVRRTCEMRTPGSCHQKKHHRDLRWKSKSPNTE